MTARLRGWRGGSGSGCLRWAQGVRSEGPLDLSEKKRGELEVIDPCGRRHEHENDTGWNVSKQEVN